ncbi:hypothetical protein [Streptomyces tibetensis]|uniref:hypothetical protein n=1 Tax=Streptomyces tibetensis TaxID=2382123 RepID=UPI0033EC419C
MNDGPETPADDDVDFSPAVSPGDVVLFGKSWYVSSRRKDWRKTAGLLRGVVVPSSALAEDHPVPLVLYTGGRVVDIREPLSKMSRGEKVYIAHVKRDDPGINVEQSVAEIVDNARSELAKASAERILGLANFEGPEKVSLLGRRSCPWDGNPRPCEVHDL